MVQAWFVVMIALVLVQNASALKQDAQGVTLDGQNTQTAPQEAQAPQNQVPVVPTQTASTLMGGLSPVVYLPGQWAGSIPGSFHAPLAIEPPHPEGPRVPMQYFIPPGYYPPQFFPQHYFAYPGQAAVPWLNAMGAF